MEGVNSWLNSWKWLDYPVGTWSMTLSILSSELTLPQFYSFLHEMERAKSSLECFTWPSPRGAALPSQHLQGHIFMYLYHPSYIHNNTRSSAAGLPSWVRSSIPETFSMCLSWWDLPYCWILWVRGGWAKDSIFHRDSRGNLTPYPMNMEIKKLLDKHEDFSIDKTCKGHL